MVAKYTAIREFLLHKCLYVNTFTTEQGLIVFLQRKGVSIALF